MSSYSNFPPNRPPNNLPPYFSGLIFQPNYSNITHGLPSQLAPTYPSGCGGLIGEFSALEPQIGTNYSVSFGMASAANGIQDPVVTINSSNPKRVEMVLADNNLVPVSVNGNNVSYNLGNFGAAGIVCRNAVESNTITF